MFPDLEDACAPLAKPGARKNIVAALNEGGWGEKIRTVRVNDWTTEWTFQDVLEVVGGAGADLDAIMLPKVQPPRQGAGSAAHPDREGQRPRRRPDRHPGTDRDGAGSDQRQRHRVSSERIETVIFGPADFMASINMKSLNRSTGMSESGRCR